MRLSLLLLAVSCFGQSFYGAGLSLYPQSSPKPTGWAAAMVTMSAPQRVYSISEIDFTAVGNILRGQPVSIQTSARTGAAVWLRAFGRVNLFGLANAGVATTGTNSSGAFAGGGMVTFPTRWKALYGTIGVRILSSATGGTQTLIETGIVWGNGK